MGRAPALDTEAIITSGGAPDRLTPKHERLALAVLRGKSNVEIAAELGYHPNRIGIIKSSPLFKALLEQLRREMLDLGVMDAVDKLHGASGVAVDALIHHASHYDEPAASVAAAKDILDRNPRTARISKSEEERTIKFTLSDETAARIANALAEDEGRVVPGVAFSPNTPVKVRALDEVLAEMEE